nr:retrovirus-related Pol polyprotein from transposon TNT 1-94 [Tanacetum cinerariifolium]
MMAAYMINRYPSTALEKKTHMDLWLGHPANYEMLRIFGCVAYSHLNQGKLKPRAIKCISLGYLDGVKGYILWRVEPTVDPHSGKNQGMKMRNKMKGLNNRIWTIMFWVILSLTACEDYELEKLDVKMVFLYAMGSAATAIICVYFKEFTLGMCIYLLMYVDDMLITWKSKFEIEYTKGLLGKVFDMKELGPARKILGMEIVRDRGSRTLKVSQSAYV